jgi:hypothetical protein
MSANDQEFLRLINYHARAKAPPSPPAPAPKLLNEIMKTLMKMLLVVIVSMAVISFFTWRQSPEYREMQQRQQAEIDYQNQLVCRANSITQAQFVACVQLLRGP